MKVSKLIEHLKYMEETYGNLEVDFLFLDEEKVLHQFNDSLHFSYDQYPDENDKFAIQNFPY